MSKLHRSFLLGGLTAAALIVLGIILTVNTGDALQLAFWSVVGVMGFTLVSCIVLDNNFVEDMVSGIFGFGFVRMPGLIFTLDLDGIIWLITVKLLFWILGIVLAILFGILAIALGLIVSIFVYPFALLMELRGEVRTKKFTFGAAKSSAGNAQSNSSYNSDTSGKGWYCSCGAYNPANANECQSCFAQRPR